MKVSSLHPPVEFCEDFSYRGADFVPQEAGCYALTNASGDILYIGKAEKLRRRMLGHLGDDTKHTLTHLGRLSRFHYALCEVSQLPSRERGWTNQFQTEEGGNLPYFNKINPSV